MGLSHMFQLSNLAKQAGKIIAICTNEGNSDYKQLLMALGLTTK